MFALRIRYSRQTAQSSVVGTMLEHVRLEHCFTKGKAVFVPLFRLYFSCVSMKPCNVIAIAVMKQAMLEHVRFQYGFPRADARSISKEMFESFL